MERSESDRAVPSRSARFLISRIDAPFLFCSQTAGRSAGSGNFFRVYFIQQYQTSDSLFPCFLLRPNFVRFEEPFIAKNVRAIFSRHFSLCRRFCSVVRTACATKTLQTSAERREKMLMKFREREKNGWLLFVAFSPFAVGMRDVHLESDGAEQSETHFFCRCKLFPRIIE